MRRSGAEGTGELTEVREVLSHEQEEAVSGLKEQLKRRPPEQHQWKARQPRVAAVVGARGSGKSTVLHRIRHELANESGFLCSAVLDVGTIREDLGIMAMALDELMDMAGVDRSEGPPEPSGRGQGWARVTHTLKNKEINEQFEHCFQSALLEEESHRRLAQDLAMSPGHYANIIYDAAQRRRKHRSEFDVLVKSLRSSARRRLSERDRGRAEPEGPCLVLFLDDVDLGQPETIQNWARALLTHYQNDSVLWVLSFDRARLIRLLSHRLPDETTEGDGRIDRFSGRALLQKLVPPHQQWELSRWRIEDRRAFCPLKRERPDESSGDAATVSGDPALEALIRERNLAQILPLLPAYPRSLESLYRQLELSRKFPRDQFVRQVALGEGEDDLVEELDRRGIGLLASSQRWDDGDSLSDARWHGILEYVRKDAPLWGLPVPRELDELIEGPEPEAFLEALLDVALAERDLTPFQLLTRLPFTYRLLEQAMARLDFPGDDVVQAFESPRSPLGDRRQAAQVQNFSLFWQLWPTTEQEQRWRCSIGPLHLWRAAYRFRSPLPSPLLRQLRLDLPGVESVDQVKIAKRPFLPYSLRSLLLLVYRLQQAPWQELDAKRKLWSPVTFTQVVAIFTLTAYLPRLITKGEDLERWLDPERLLGELVEGKREVEESLVSLIAGLDAGFGPFEKGDLDVKLWDAKIEIRHPETPREAAELELLCALDGLRQLTMVRGLAPGSGTVD